MRCRSDKAIQVAQDVELGSCRRSPTALWPNVLFHIEPPGEKACRASLLVFPIKQAERANLQAVGQYARSLHGPPVEIDQRPETSKPQRRMQDSNPA